MAAIHPGGVQHFEKRKELAQYTSGSLIVMSRPMCQVVDVRDRFGSDAPDELIVRSSKKNRLGIFAKGITAL